MADCGHDWFAFGLIPNGPALATAVEIFIRHAGELPRGLAPIRPGRAIARVCSPRVRSEEHTSELQSLMRISYAVFCLKKNRFPLPPACSKQAEADQLRALNLITARVSSTDTPTAHSTNIQ